MPSVQCLPDKSGFDINENETILEAALRANIPLAHACGGVAKCSTCRVSVLDGIENCEARTENELSLSDSLGFGNEMRLACQTRLRGDVKLRRLVLDEADLEITSQLSTKRLGRCGESKNVAVMFCDIRDFTQFSEGLSPYDVMFVLNRYFYKMGEVVERNGGYIDKFIGDEIMALFGIDDDPYAPLRSIKAALEMLDTVDHLKPYMKSMYGSEFDVRIGVHYGEAVIGSVGSTNENKLTAIGDTVNIASRIEAANKEAGTRFLASDDLYELIKDDVIVDDFVRIKLRGSSDRRTLYQISAVDFASLKELADDQQQDPTKTRFAGLEWTQIIEEMELPVGTRKVIELAAFDLLLIRTEKVIYGLNNACPHLRLPIDDSEITEDGVIVCRWHNSRFDLRTGEIIDWCSKLEEDGTSKGMEQLGNISKNKEPVEMVPVRIADDKIWAALG